MSIDIILLTLMGDKNDDKFGCTVNGIQAYSYISYLLSFQLQFFLVKLNYYFHWIVVMLHRFYSISKLISFGNVSNDIHRISFGQTNERFGLHVCLTHGSHPWQCNKQTSTYMSSTVDPHCECMFVFLFWPKDRTSCMLLVHHNWATFSITT
jgi:hypothetical protein